MNKVIKWVLIVAAVPVIAGAVSKALPNHLQPDAAAGPSDMDEIMWRTKNVDAAESKIRGLLKDPDSAQFRSVTVVQQKQFDANAVGVVCGYVNAKNSFGGYVGYKGYCDPSPSQHHPRGTSAALPLGIQGGTADPYRRAHLGNRVCNTIATVWIR